MIHTTIMPFTRVYRTADIYILNLSKLYRTADLSAVRYTNLNGIVCSHKSICNCICIHCNEFYSRLL